MSDIKKGAVDVKTGNKMLPKIVEELCIGCAHCVKRCPFGVLELKSGIATVVNPEGCDSEGLCISVCPTGSLRQLAPQEY